MGVDKTTSLEIFKTKISECIEMVGLMGPHERISVSSYSISDYYIFLNMFFSGCGDLE